MYALRSLNDGFTFRSLLNLRTFKVFQGLYSRSILNYAFDFWLAEKYFQISTFLEKWSGQNWTSRTGSTSLAQVLKSKLVVSFVSFAYFNPKSIMPK